MLATEEASAVDELQDASWSLEAADEEQDSTTGNPKPLTKLPVG